jgi:transcriptional regulator with XRE-family HTH domain
VLAGHPHYVAELTQFAASLVATSGYERAEPTAQTRAIAERARTRALAALFPVAAAAPSHLAGGLGARAVASLKALRRAHGLSLAAAARRLGLGLDVVQNLEAGLIRAASVPERLTRALGELLETSAEQIRAALDAQLVLRPALQRDRSANAAELPELDFAEAVRLSPAMTAAQKAEWLAS